MPSTDNAGVKAESKTKIEWKKNNFNHKYFSVSVYTFLKSVVFKYGSSDFQNLEKSKTFASRNGNAVLSFPYEKTEDSATLFTEQEPLPATLDPSENAAAKTNP